MATMVYRGLQSCLESQFIETNWTSHLAQIKLASSNIPQFPPPPFEFSLKSCFNTAGDIPPPPPPKCIYKTINPLPIPLPLSLPVVENDGNSDKLPKAAMVSKKGEEVYVHPQVKRSRSTLSEKSLWLCTENLGNETGVDFIAAEDYIFSDMKAESLPTRKRRVKSQDVQRKEFPPPLTTISGMDSLHVRSHRENGRLIMEAVKAPSKHSYFHIERSHGRLRLSVLKSADFDFDSNEEEEDKTIVDEVKEVDEKCDFEEDVGRKVEKINEYEENVGVEVEIEKIGRTCRCKDGENNIDNNNNNNNGMLLNWEPMSMWVATS